MAAGFAGLVVAKAPVPGLAKTRLAGVVGAERAAYVAAASLQDTLAAVEAAVDCRVLAQAGALGEAAEADRLASRLRRWAVVRQPRGGLAVRLAHAHRAAARVARGRPVLQIGMDTPQVTADLLGDAAAALRSRWVDAVIGLAADGGWWALGLCDPRLGRVLPAVPMSTSDTGELTLRALRRAGVRTAVVPMLRDVDTWDDALAVAALTPGTRFAAAVAAERVVKP